METGERNLSKVFWTEALTGGLIIGILLFVWDLIGYWLNLPMSNSKIGSLVQILILVGGIVYFCRRMREFRGPELGFPYGSVFGFVMGMMLFTGLVYGIGMYLLHAIIAPAYFDEVFEIALWDTGLDDYLIEQALEMRGLVKSPFMMIFSGVFSMCLYGGLVGLLVAAFLRRNPDPFVNTQNDYNPDL